MMWDVEVWREGRRWMSGAAASRGAATTRRQDEDVARRWALSSASK